MEFTSIIKTVAPWIGTVLGTPLAGMAIAAAADALGASDKTVDGIKKALSGATPEQMLALKNADDQFALRMRELGFAQIKDLETLAVADRDSARKMQMTIHSVVPAALTWVVGGTFGAVLAFLFLRDVPVANRDIVVYMVGQLSGAFTTTIAFWFGTTRESSRKTELLAKTDAVKEPVSDSTA